jgi:hypothetical protein
LTTSNICVLYPFLSPDTNNDEAGAMAIDGLLLLMHESGDDDLFPQQEITKEQFDQCYRDWKELDPMPPDDDEDLQVFQKATYLCMLALASCIYTPIYGIQTRLRLNNEFGINENERAQGGNNVYRLADYFFFTGSLLAYKDRNIEAWLLSHTKPGLAKRFMTSEGVQFANELYKRLSFMGEIKDARVSLMHHAWVCVSPFFWYANIQPQYWKQAETKLNDLTESLVQKNMFYAATLCALSLCKAAISLGNAALYEESMEFLCDSSLSSDRAGTLSCNSDSCRYRNLAIAAYIFEHDATKIHTLWVKVSNLKAKYPTVPNPGSRTLCAFYFSCMLCNIALDDNDFASARDTLNITLNPSVLKIYGRGLFVSIWSAFEFWNI